MPGTDLVFDHYQRGYHRTLSRWPASTAHQLGLPRVYFEAMGAMGWSVTPELTREVIGAFAVRGVNQALLHAAYTDPSQIPYPPPFQPVNPWWDLSTPLNEWIGRVMEAGRAPARARTALLQPQRAAEAFQDTPSVAEIDRAFTETVHALEDVQVDFDLVDEGALDGDPALAEHARPHGPQLVVGKQSYDIVVLPQAPMLAVGAVETLIRFVRGGGTVVVVGALPVQDAGGDDAALARALRSLFSGEGAGRATRAQGAAKAAEAVAAAGGAAASLSPPVTEVRVLRFERGRERAFLVTNERTEAVAVTATFPATGTPQICDPDTGEVAMAGVWRQERLAGASGTAVPLRLDPKATLLIVFRDPRHGVPAHAVSSTAPVQEVAITSRSAAATVRVTGPGPVQVEATDGGRLYRGSAVVQDKLTAVPLDGAWTFRFDRDGAVPSSRPLGSWTALDRAHSGSAIYERELTLDAATLGDRLWTLDLGEVHEVAEIEVNGARVASRLWRPYRADVTAALRPGRNLIRIRVTNTGANTRGENLPSGLLGPVALRPSRLVEVPLARVRS